MTVLSYTFLYEQNYYKSMNLFCPSCRTRRRLTCITCAAYTLRGYARDDAGSSHFISLANKNPASNVISAPKKNGALVPGQRKSAIHEADPIQFQI